jgi:hypothetical protein
MRDFPYLIIGDHNAHEYSRPADEPGYKGWQQPAAPHTFYRGPRPVGPLVPRSEWTRRIEQGQGSFLSDLKRQHNIEALDQDGLNYCWAYGSVRAAQYWRLLKGLRWLDLSPESVAGPCVNWRNRGGYASQAFEQMERAGVCETSYMDEPWSRDPRKWKEGWQENAAQNALPNWYAIERDHVPDFDEVITCLLSRLPVAAGLPWWGHLVCFLEAVIVPAGSAPANTPDGAAVGVLFENSYGVDWPRKGANGLAVLTESRATPDGAAAPVLDGLPRWS